MEELIEQLKQGAFYYNRPGISFKSKVKSIELLKEKNDQFNIYFEGGQISVFNYGISKILRPENMINTFVWCYKLKNEYDECIGYIGEIKKR